MEDQDSLSNTRCFQGPVNELIKRCQDTVLELFFGQEWPILSEIESEELHNVLENKNLCTLFSKILSPSQASSEEQMSGGLQPPTRLKGPRGQHGFWELGVSCSKVLPCTEGLVLSLH